MTWRAEIGSGDRRAGFTLIEMIVVVAVLGLMLGLVVSRGPMRSRTLSARAAVGAVAGGLREARARAISTNHPVEFTLDIEHKAFRVDQAPPIWLPPEYGLSLMTVSGERRSETEGAIRFAPDGSSTGGRIELTAGSRHVKIGVDWLSGRVSVTDAP
jgi:general secretion pathway protein H